jgi:hypothetical protein
MAGKLLRGRKVIGAITCALALAAAGLAWTERTTLLSCFFVHGLVRADERSRDGWVERVAALGDAAMPELVGALANPDPAACANARTALARLSADWEPADARRTGLAQRLARGWDGFSSPGRACALEVAAGLFRAEQASTPQLVSACTQLLAAASHADVPVQPRALALCAALLSRDSAEAVSPGRGVVRAGLGHPAPPTRVLAIRLALYPGMDLLEDVAPLLNDPTPEVRRAAVVAVGPSEQSVRDDGLLTCLHDPDAEVRRLGELALRGRGLRPEHIKLGKVLTDPNPVVRLQVLDQLRLAPDLDAGIWLRRLSHDSSPAVRVAAMRAMIQQSAVDLTDRIDQMARNDPSPTVCVLARYYLRRARPADIDPR